MRSTYQIAAAWTEILQTLKALRVKQAVALSKYGPYDDRNSLYHM